MSEFTSAGHIWYRVNTVWKCAFCAYEVFTEDKPFEDELCIQTYSKSKKIDFVTCSKRVEIEKAIFDYETVKDILSE